MDNIGAFYFSELSRSIRTDAHRRRSSIELILPSSLAYFFKGQPDRSSIARVERAHSFVRVPRAGGRPGRPSHPSETARCASIEDHQAPSPSLLQTSTKGSGQGCPLLRALSDHSFIVGALRVRRMMWLLSLPSKLTHFTLPGRAPVLVYVRPSNEALLRARVPGAQDQHGCPSPSHLSLRNMVR